MVPASSPDSPHRVLRQESIVTGKVVTINIPANADTYVALELQADGDSTVIPYMCDSGQSLCRLLKVGDRVSYTLRDGSWWVSYVQRAPQA